MDTLIVNDTNVNIYDRIRLHLDGKWKAYEMGIYFQALQNLYDLEMFFTFISIPEKLEALIDYDPYIEGIEEAINKSEQRKIIAINCLYKILKQEYNYGDYEGDDNEGLFVPLEIVQIKIASPGINDIGGLSGIIGHLKDILFQYLPNKEKRIKNKDAELDLEIKEQKRNQEIVKTLEMSGFEKEEIKQLLIQRKLNSDSIKSLYETGKIISLEEKWKDPER